MHDTFDYRQNKLKLKLVGATEILKEFPRFVDFKDGALVNKLLNL